MPDSRTDGGLPQEPDPETTLGSSEASGEEGHSLRDNPALPKRGRGKRGRRRTRKGVRLRNSKDQTKVEEGRGQDDPIVAGADDELTPMQRAFCEAYVVDPTNASAAARVAGCGDSAGVTAYKWLKLNKVQGYLAELRSRAIQKEPAAVAELSEALAVQTKVMRREAKEYEAATDPKERDPRFAIKASEVLIKHYDALEAPRQGVTINWLQVLNQLDAQTVEALRAAWVKALPQTVEAG